MSGPAEPRYDGSEIAVVGMSGRFPGAADLDAFWRNIEAGVESIAVFSDEELLQAGEDPKRLEDPSYVRARPILDGVELFDAAFFGFTPREAEILDPQMRQFLECAWGALEHAGHDTERFPGAISLFAGASFSNYLVHNLYKNRPAMEAFGDLQSTIYNVQDSLVTMVGYKLNLKGACCAVQTFCSTSLVGVHFACQNLLNYESDMALAGGVTVHVPQRSGYLYEEGSIVSREGHCRVFDARADGTVFGSGVGVVVLRRLKDALEDGNTVHAVIRGSAINNDGSLKVSFSAPGVVGQTEVIVEALAAADVDAETIGYVEAHGTGTRLGDPVEVSALTKAFHTRTARKGFCALGSVKTNVGHLDAAAGVTGLIKVILALERGQIPPSLHFEEPNPAIDFANSPFYVNTALREWPRSGSPRRAGVSAFGVGGTNAHVILEEAPSRAKEPSGRSHQLLVVSAKTASALDTATRQLAAHLAAHPELPLADVAYTLQAGRRAFGHRRIAVCSSQGEAVTALGGGTLPTATAQWRNPPVVLLLASEEPGRVDGWRGLYAQEPTFREALLRCAGVAGDVGRTLREIFEAVPVASSPNTDGLEPLGTFAVEYALARLWESWGLSFEAVRGEGVGELVAACLSGVLPLETAVRMAARRGRPAAFPEAVGVQPPEGYGTGAAGASLPAEPSRLFLELGCRHVALRGPCGGVPAISAASGQAFHGYREMLEVLGGLWLAGADFGWTALHAPERRQRVPLPSYPFERQRFWVEPLKDDAPRPETDGQRPGVWLYQPVWKTALPPVESREEGPARSLVFVDSCGVGSRLAERLRGRGCEVITVSAASGFSGDPAAGYWLDPAEPGQYAALWTDLQHRQKLPERLVHFWAMDCLDAAAPSWERFRRASDLGFYSLLHVAASRPESPLAVTVVSAGLHEVIGGEALAPEKAPLLPLCRVLAQEHHDLRCASIDLDPEAGDVAQADLVLAELTPGQPEPVIAYRRGRRWVQGYEPIPASRPEPRSARLRDGGVYLVTGGLGDVGFVLAYSLARQTRAKLVLTGRTGLLPRERWNEWLGTHDATETIAVRIRKVQALEAAGAEVLIAKADAADPEEMKAAVGLARERFGALHGVIHAAGELAVDTFRPVRELGRGACERQFAPKVHGLLTLAEALQDQVLDFCMLTSSLSSVLGGVGYAAYAAANAFLDAFAARKSQEGCGSWISVDWDQWEFPGRTGSGLAVREGATLRPHEGMAAFERILRLPSLDRVVVSSGPLEARLERWVRLAASSQKADPAAADARPRPLLGNPYETPANDVERVLAGIWQELLGVQKIGIQDNFFELGGHSLFAARVLSRVRRAFGVSLPLAAVFEAPTVAQLAARVAAARSARDGAGTAGSEPGDRVEIEI